MKKKKWVVSLENKIQAPHSVTHSKAEKLKNCYDEDTEQLFSHFLQMKSKNGFQWEKKL